MAIKLKSKIKEIDNDWYIKIMRIKAENKGLCTATYGYFTDAASAQNDSNAIEFYNFMFECITGEDIFKQGYIHLKLLPEFAESQDILEQEQVEESSKYKLNS